MGNAAGLARKTCAISALILGIGLTSAAFACPSPESLSGGALDRAFTQEKYMSGMDHPLRSTGRLVARDKEIVWQMLTPFDVKTTITPDGISQSVNGGAPTEVATGSADISGMIARLMASMMRGDWNSLKSTFAVSLPDRADARQWVVRLSPLDDHLKALLGTIDVRGCEDVSSVDIERTDGDREHIQFETATP